MSDYAPSKSVQIARIQAIADSDKPLTGQQLVELQQIIGWSRLQLAKRLHCSEGLIRKMEAGRYISSVAKAFLVGVALAVVSLAPETREEWDEVD